MDNTKKLAILWKARDLLITNLKNSFKTKKEKITKREKKHSYSVISE